MLKGWIVPGAAAKEDEGMDEKVYIPEPYDIAGFDLIGYRQADGSIKLGPEGKGTHLPDFPESVRVLSVVYKLENVKENWNLSNLPEGHDGYNIEWGEYA